MTETDNIWVVTARVVDKVKSLDGNISTGLGGWTRATFPTQALAEQFHEWVQKQTIAGRLINSQGVSYLIEDDEYLVRFK